MQENLGRHKVAMYTRNYLSGMDSSGGGPMLTSPLLKGEDYLVPTVNLERFAFPVPQLFSRFS